MARDRRASGNGLGDYAFSVKLGQDGLDQLRQLQRIYEGESLSNAAISRGEVIRRAIRDALLGELGRRANLDDPTDEFTAAYLAVASGVGEPSGELSPGEERALAHARDQLLQLQPKPTKKRGKK